MVHKDNLEPLRGKERTIFNGFRTDTIKVFEKECVKSAVEFYKKYRDISLLQKEIPEVYEKWLEFYNKPRDITYASVYDYYCRWLFDYCFGDVIE